MPTGLSAFNRALNLIPRRAEKRQAEELRQTFVDTGVATVLESVDHQVLYGRRGAGKTHALKFLETTVASRGELAIYLDLRTIGSPTGLLDGEDIAPVERAARLLVDLLQAFQDELVAAATADNRLVSNKMFVDALDSLEEAISTVHVVGQIEIIRETEHVREKGHDTSVSAGLFAEPKLSGSLSNRKSDARRDSTSNKRTGSERVSVNFTEVAYALRAIASNLRGKRLWLLLDEWSSVPTTVQPLLGEFLVRCLLPLNKFTVKIAAIEQQTAFRGQLAGREVGIELGADVAANISLDEFMVYEENEHRSTEFFLGLMFKHLTSSVSDESDDLGLRIEGDVIRLGFTDRRAFDELVRAAEGVPRDAINIAAKAGFRAQTDRISVADIRAAARAWYQTDKEPPLRSRPEAERLLTWIIQNVIRERRARGFLVNQRAAQAPLLLALFEARVLHLVRRGYSAQDEPGERYDVWVIDFGAYVDLISTRYEPEGLFPASDVLDVPIEDVDLVPSQDLRMIRRAVLDLDKFESGVGRWNERSFRRRR